MPQSNRHNLPSPLSSFIGRKNEIAEVQEKLSSNRLVTLTGAGGSGKTRLAIEVAHWVAEDFANGLCWVELASLADAKLVPQTVAEAIGVREAQNVELQEKLANFLSEKEFLLLLDNCEHLIVACATLAEYLLQKCPDLKILSTSREPLGISGETVVIVPPLSLPEPQPWRDPTSAQAALPVYQRSEAVQLFSQRAEAVAQGFTLSVETGPWVADICRRLDGMPLAIELAAARVRTLPVRQIAERIDDRFGLLTAGSRTAPARQQTLEATIDWSYGLLSPSEQKLLQRLSVFAGGATLDALVSVCAGDGIDRDEVVDLASQLVSKSMVFTEEKLGAARFNLLETIRQYAYKKLSESGELETTKVKHLQYFGIWAEGVAPHLEGKNQIEWLDRFEIDHDNVRSAVEFALSANRAEEGLRLGASAGLFWKLRGFHSEGRQRLEAILAHPDAQESTLARARALSAAHTLAFYQSDYAVVRELCNECLAIAEQLGDVAKLEVADSIETLAEVANETGDYVSAPDLYEKALGLYRELGDLARIGMTLKMMAWGKMRVGHYDQAEPYFMEGLEVLKRSGDQHHIASALHGLGELELRKGDLARAKGYLVEGLNLSRSIGEKWGEAIALGSLGWVALRERDFKETRSLLGESLAIRTETEDRGGTAWCLEKLAEGANLLGENEKAVLLYAAAAALRATVDSAMDPIDRPNYEQIISNLQGALGMEEFSRIWAHGELMPLEEAVDLGLSEPPAGGAEKEKFGGLSAREREVAKLIAEGKSNREIATVMTVGVKTVETYVTRILSKLGFDSRVQIATWITEKKETQ